MPKMKTHSGAAKRFKITGTGKVMRLRANRQHLFEHKSSRVTRRLSGEVADGQGRRPRDQATARQVASSRQLSRVQ